MLHTKYRPSTWDEVIGNDASVNSLRAILSSDSPSHFYMFIGEGGTGKTTMARLIASSLGIRQVEEINAADSNGVEFARDLSSRIMYKAFGERKMYIIDECQRLTPEAQDVLLKNVLEDTPDHAYVVFCTTNPEKIKKTVLSRAAKYYMKKPSNQELVSFLEKVAEKESIPLSRKLLGKIARSTNQVMRDALVLLNQTRDVSEEDAESIIAGFDGDNETEMVDLARVLIANKDWNSIIPAIKGLRVNADSVILFLQSYMSKVLLNERGNNKEVAFNVMVAAQGYKLGSGQPGLVKTCYEAYLRNSDRRKR